MYKDRQTILFNQMDDAMNIYIKQLDRLQQNKIPDHLTHIHKKQNKIKETGMV